MKRFALLCLLAFSLCAAFAAEKARDIVSSAMSGVTPPVPARYTPAAAMPGFALPLQEKKWTIMVFMNGKNDLSEDGYDDLQEMGAVGSSEQINVVVEQGSMNGMTGEFGSVQRMYMVKHETEETRNVLLGSSKKKVDMGDWREAVRFVKYAKKNFPARHYMLIMWNHGSGWKSKGKAIEGTAVEDGETLNRGVSYDDETGNDITTIEMRAMLKAMGGVDVLAYDACLMSEIAANAEVTNHAGYVVGSEDNEPNGGYDYSRLLSVFDANWQMSPKEAALAVVNMFGQAYKGSGKNVTTSAVDNAELRKFVDLTKKFVRLTVTTSDPAAVVKAYDDVHRFYDRSLADYYDFLALVNANTKDGELKALTAEMMKQLDAKVVVKNVAQGSHSGKAKGLSVYLPQDKYDKEYDKLLFTKYTSWGELVNFVFKTKAGMTR